MSSLFEKTYVEVPFARARQYLADSLADLAQSGKKQTIPLRLEILHMTHNVVVHYAPSVDPMHFDQPWKIHWSPEGGGLYPDFDGQLCVRAGDDFTGCALELEGSYAPPLGAIGEAFDALAGKHIAESTAQTLLQSIAARMLERHAREEAAKTP